MKIKDMPSRRERMGNHPSFLGTGYIQFSQTKYELKNFVNVPVYPTVPHSNPGAYVHSPAVVKEEFELGWS
ncbi:unnamed protein product [Leptosia nina]|uniref:Uncharacterized protein n=1 Tax=Leptosia nina TaxID=320188 RepID=A0AAV1J263_9NEOP